MPTKLKSPRVVHAPFLVALPNELCVCIDVDEQDRDAAFDGTEHAYHGRCASRLGTDAATGRGATTSAAAAAGGSTTTRSVAGAAGSAGTAAATVVHGVSAFVPRPTGRGYGATGSAPAGGSTV